MKNGVEGFADPSPRCLGWKSILAVRLRFDAMGIHSLNRLRTDGYVEPLLQPNSDCREIAAFLLDNLSGK
jgi:hypothetical protein